MPKNFAEFGGTTPPLIYEESAKNPTQKAEIILRLLGVLPPPHLQKTLPKALRTQALTALTSNFGLVGLVQYAW